MDATDAVFTSLLEDSAEELYEQAPCGYLSTMMDGTIAKINATLLEWLDLERGQVVGRMRFTDLLTVGGKLYHETHFSLMLQMKGEVSGVALDIKAAGERMPVLVTSRVKTSDAGESMLIRTPDEAQMRKLMKREDPRTFPGIYVTCNDNPARRLCTPSDEPTTSPSLGKCKPLICKNVALTRKNLDAWQSHLVRLEDRIAHGRALAPLVLDALVRRRDDITGFLCKHDLDSTAKDQA